MVKPPRHYPKPGENEYGIPSWPIRLGDRRWWTSKRCMTCHWPIPIESMYCRVCGENPAKWKLRDCLILLVVVLGVLAAVYAAV